ncbi:beta-phosphoglucomutase [Hankyongella ginsenosidimutans]|uniref:beta-phosphoglucomutase n=1 Tax=Hankyongella ginsenosidimutans TaxID=1763828 RepID=UPI001CA35A19|nr:beta-phosphoglucomutase [Hankyongella ginsenosidimutans]
MPATVRAPAPDIEAVIFDLDGVLTDTAEAHFRAWNRLASELGVPFDAVFNEQLKGVDRAGSLALILARGGLDLPEDEREALMARKNGYYLEEIADFSPDHLFPGARAVLQACRVNGLRVGLASASRNAPLLLRRLGIADLFDFVADAGAVARSKPAPDIFLAAAAGLGVVPEACLGVEDSRPAWPPFRQPGCARSVSATRQPLKRRRPCLRISPRFTSLTGWTESLPSPLTNEASPEGNRSTQRRIETC